MRPGAVLLNFSRDGVVDDGAVLDALATGRLGQYVCDFPGAALHGQRARRSRCRTSARRRAKPRTTAR